MPVVDVCLTASSGSGGAAGVRLGEPVLDAYLEFVAAPCRPNTVLAVAFDPKGSTLPALLSRISPWSTP